MSLGTTPAPGEHWRRRGRKVSLWSAVTGMVLALAAGVVAWSWRPELPEPVAVHWSADGRPDGFGPLAHSIAVLVATAALLCLMFATFGWLWGQAAVTRRLVAAACVWSGAFAAVQLLTSVGFQRGLADAAEA